MIGEKSIKQAKVLLHVAMDSVFPGPASQSYCWRSVRRLRVLYPGE